MRFDVIALNEAGHVPLAEIGRVPVPGDRRGGGVRRADHHHQPPFSEWTQVWNLDANEQFSVSKNTTRHRMRASDTEGQCLCGFGAYSLSFSCA